MTIKYINKASVLLCFLLFLQTCIGQQTYQGLSNKAKDSPISNEHSHLYQQIRILQAQGETNTTTNHTTTTTNTTTQETTSNTTNTQTNTTNHTTSENSTESNTTESNTTQGNKTQENTSGQNGTEQNTGEGNSTEEQVAQTECENQCKILQYYQCTVCYDLCTTTLGSHSNSTFTMKSCTLKKCAKYKSQPTSEENPTSTVTQCVEQQTQILNEEQCTQECCHEPEYHAFTADTWEQCVQNQQSKTQTESLIGLIIGTVLGSSLFLIILVICCCCYKDKVILCCKNAGWCVESIFTGGRATKIKKKQSETKDTHSHQSEVDINGRQLPKLYRFNRKWVSIQRKTEVSELPTSKYIIQSQYEINPEVYCSICLDPELNCKTACGHSFHFSCLREYLSKNMKCPECGTKKFNPLKINCEDCGDRQTSYDVDKKNAKVKYPDFYHNDKIYCDKCLKKLQLERENNEQ